MELLRKVGWLNLLLVFVPTAIGLEIAGVSKTAIFVTSAIAIIPLASLMGEGTEVLTGLDRESVDC